MDVGLSGRAELDWCWPRLLNVSAAALIHSDEPRANTARLSTLSAYRRFLEALRPASLLDTGGPKLKDKRHNRLISAHVPSVGFEFACLGEDFGEAVCQAVEAGAGVGVREGAAVDQDAVLSGEQGVDEAIETGAQGCG